MLTPDLRPDAHQFRDLLREREFRSLWHFTRLACAPAILHHGALYSIEELERRGLTVPPRPSRDHDIACGVGDFVKLSTMPYWDMLSSLLRAGEPTVLIEFSTTPILLAGTRFGDRNVWEGGWILGDSFEFARDYVLVRKPRWRGGSPPEVYVARELRLVPHARRVLTYTIEEFQLLTECLNRLGIVPSVQIAPNGPQWPFPDRCHDDHQRARGSNLAKVREYFRHLTIESLDRGVEIDDD